MDAVNGTNDTGPATGPGPGGHGPGGHAPADVPGENPAAGAPAISLHAPAPTGPAGTHGPAGATAP
ncbi:collagen-like protein, partial [Streptomyces sp. NPDC058049]